MPNNTIIAFEGLDCSFKETNFKSFVMHLRASRRRPGFSIITQSFPRYNHPASYCVEKWLGNNYDRDVLKQHPIAVNSFYNLDRHDYWYHKSNNGDDTDYRWIDIINGDRNKDVFTYFVFDRYILSNIIYNPLYDKACIDDFIFSTDSFAIPKPNIIVWMRIRSFNVLCKLLEKKENKDANELDIDFLKKIWERSESLIKSDIFDKLGIKLIVVDCLDEGMNIKSEREISDYIWEQVCAAVEF